MTDTNNIELNPCPFCGGAPMDHAIEPHTHSPFLKSLGIPDHGGSHVVECGCGAGLIDDTKDAVFARWNQRALTARASAGEGGVAEIMRGCLTAIESGHDPRYGFPTGPSIEGIEEAAKRIAALTAAPQPAQAGASGGGEIPVCPRCSKALPPRRGAGRTLFSTPCTDCMEWKSPHRDTPASPATGEDFEAWFAKQDSRTEWRELVRLAYYATSQPAQAGASGGGEWGDWLESQSDDDLLTIFAFRPDLAERLRAIIATPPAHGDGEGLLVHVGDALSHAFPEDIAEWKRVCRIVYPFLRERLTTHPTPEAQEARDAAVETIIRDVCELDPSDPEHHDTVCVKRHHLRQIIKRTLALPAQGGEGE